jgi:DNA-binding transcriptional LysR family regulator
MVHSGLGVGLLPDRALALLHSVGELVAVPLTDVWATRDILLVARDWGSLPVTARLLADHLGASPGPATSLAP